MNNDGFTIAGKVAESALNNNDENPTTTDAAETLYLNKLRIQGRMLTNRGDGHNRWAQLPNKCHLCNVFLPNLANLARSKL